MSTENTEIKYGRGKRLRMARGMAGLSLTQLAAKLKISYRTANEWENARMGGLTLKGAEKVSALLRPLGVNCSHVWLLYDMGDPPCFVNKAQEALVKKERDPTLHSPQAIALHHQKTIVEEAQFFCDKNYDAVVLEISDGAMSPLVSKGDWVGGIIDRHPDKTSLVNQNCIVELAGGMKVCKPLTQQMLKNPKIVNIAPVLWIRKAYKPR